MMVNNCILYFHFVAIFTILDASHITGGNDHGETDHGANGPHGNDHGGNDHGGNDHAESDHGENDHGETDHGANGPHENDHGGNDHGGNDHAESDHGGNDHGETDHPESDHAESDHDEIDHGANGHGANGPDETDHGANGPDKNGHGETDHGESDHDEIDHGGNGAPNMLSPYFDQLEISLLNPSIIEKDSFQDIHLDELGLPDAFACMIANEQGIHQQLLIIDNNQAINIDGTEKSMSNTSKVRNVNNSFSSPPSWRTRSKLKNHKEIRAEKGTRQSMVYE